MTERATLANGQTVEFLPEMIGEGGMKKVYFTADRKSVVCFYKDASSAVDPNRMARLDAVLNRWNPTTAADTGAYFSNLFCWVTGIVLQPRVGLVTPVYPGNFYFASGRWKGKPKVGKWFSSPKLRKMLPEAERGTWLNYLQLSILMARAVRRLHAAGLAHSDLSCNNILIDPPGGKIVVIDIDSLVVPGLFNPDVLGTPGYIAPEVIATSHLAPTDPQRKLPSTKTDLHALPVLIYEYLLQRHPLRGPKVHANTAEEDERLAMGQKALFIENPHDTSNRPTRKHGYELQITSSQLGPHIDKLLQKAFVTGLHSPEARPTAAEWESDLCRTSDLLIPCGNPSCEEKWFIYLEGQAPKCPFCGWKLGRQIPLLEFHYAPRKGQFIPEKRYLVAWDQRPLNLWHVFTNVRPDERAPKDTQAYVCYYQNQWILVNKLLTSMLSPSGKPVPLGQACPLTPGGAILLSQEPKARMVTVRMIP
ncbi:MAG: serine/threonine protein kinase [Planctomycetes bacterium]|nr:serine/threonine protein kinase [Planctomycetota bacterium]